MKEQSYSIWETSTSATLELALNAQKSDGLMITDQ